MTTLHVNEKQTVDGYPYGRLKCTAFFYIEFSPTKGFRNVFQTINPKTNSLNAPKRGTYHDICYMKNVDGFITQHSLSFYEKESINRNAKFLNENFDLFNEEQILFIYQLMLTFMKVSVKSMVQYCNAKLEDVTPFYDAAIKIVVKGINEKINVFGEISIDVEGLEKTKDPDYNPFRTVKVA